MEEMTKEIKRRFNSLALYTDIPQLFTPSRTKDYHSHPRLSFKRNTARQTAYLVFMVCQTKGTIALEGLWCCGRQQDLPAMAKGAPNPVTEGFLKLAL
jgi:hypothetical protein